ncbi:MAG TPA: toll/interleukin-1 receptor domain-containing protein [Terrimicrobiaceae bacterium]
MVFISYSHADEDWCKRFLVMAKPLQRYAEISVWSDTNIGPGKPWPSEIRKALDEASVAVLLVSDNFLASDFIANEELPYILKARRERALEVLWIPLSPSYFQLTPLATIQAVIAPSKPLNSMVEFGYKAAFCELCQRIDQVVKEAETPIINRTLNGRRLQRVQRKLQVLAKPAKRETEVLLYCGDNKWYTQSRIAKGSMTSDCWIGDEKHTKRGDTFKILAITRQGRLSPGTSHLNIPVHRTRSEKVTIIRD